MVFITVIKNKIPNDFFALIVKSLGISHISFLRSRDFPFHCARDFLHAQSKKSNPQSTPQSSVHNCHKKSNPPIACTVKWGCKENLMIYGVHNCHMRDDEKGFYSIYATILRSNLKIFMLKPGIVFTLRDETRAAMIFHVHR